MSVSYDDNNRLISLAQSGDGEAMDMLIATNMGLCKSIALRFRDRGVEYEDLVQIASIGMIKAVKSFDFSYNTAFSTYAVPLIIGEIRRFLRDDGIIKVGRGTKRCGVDAMRRREAFIRDNGREPRISELAGLCGVSEDELVYSLEAISPVHSLNESMGEDDSMTLESIIADNESPIEGITDRIALYEAIKKLPEQQQKLIILRYFKDMSQQRTGQILGMTQVKVSREEKKIIEQLREAL